MDQAPTSSYSVLVVDDDRLVRDVIVDMLGDAGVDACEASNAEEALRDLQQRDNIAAVVTDVEMPGLDGIGLAERIGKARPEIGVLFISGGGRVQRPLPSGAKFLAKPFTEHALLKAIDELFRGAQPIYAAS